MRSSPVIRTAETDDLTAALAVRARQTGRPLSADEAAHVHATIDPARTLVAVAGGATTALVGGRSLLMTVPGARVDLAFLPLIVVDTARAQEGVLERLVALQLTRARERGEPLAGATMAAGAPCRALGFAAASRVAEVAIEHCRAVLTGPRGEQADLRMIDRRAAMELLPPVHERAVATGNGDVRRSAADWVFLTRAEHEHAGIGPPMVVVHSGSGGIDGYAVYRIREEHPLGGVVDGTVHLVDLTATTTASYRALWQFILGMALTDRTRARSRPVDEPLIHMLVEPRRLRRHLRAHLGLRIVDVARALEGRRYPCEGTLVIDVHDTGFPGTAGRYRLDVAPEGAACRPSGRDPDIALDAAALASIYLGDTGVDSLCRAGRLDELRSGAAGRAGAVFAWRTPPFLSGTS